MEEGVWTDKLINMNSTLQFFGKSKFQCNDRNKNFLQPAVPQNQKILDWDIEIINQVSGYGRLSVGL